VREIMFPAHGVELQETPCSVFHLTDIFATIVQANQGFQSLYRVLALRKLPQPSFQGFDLHLTDRVQRRRQCTVFPRHLSPPA